MTSPKPVRKGCQQLHARDVRGLVAFCYWTLEEKTDNKVCFTYIFKVHTVFTLIQRPDKHTELLKIDFKPLVRQINFSILVAKSDFEFKDC